VFKIKKQNKPLVLQKTKIKIKYTFAHISFFIVNYFSCNKKIFIKKTKQQKRKHIMTSEKTSRKKSPLM